MRTLTVITAALLVSALGCQKEDPRIAEILEKVNKIDKATEALAKRPAPGAAPQRKAQDPNTVYNLPVTENDVTRGARHAKVTVVEAFDFACPFCAQSRPIIEAAAAKHADDVKVVSKQFVVHPQTATLPALAVCAALKQGKATALENALWSAGWAEQNGRPNFDVTKFSQESIEKIAGDQKLDVTRLKADMASQACKDDLVRQQRELALIGVNGTPAFFINGKPYVGERTVEAFSAAVEAEAKKVDAALKDGGTVEDYYANLMKTAQKSL